MRDTSVTSHRFVAELPLITLFQSVCVCDVDRPRPIRRADVEATVGRRFGVGGERQATTARRLRVHVEAWRQVLDLPRPVRVSCAHAHACVCMCACVLHVEFNYGAMKARVLRAAAAAASR